jgi:hypothetical protein
MSNPKTDLTDNTQKDPDEWVSGDDPMTGAQASYLKTLCEQAGVDAFNEKLTKAEASKLIDELRARRQEWDAGRADDDKLNGTSSRCSVRRPSTEVTEMLVVPYLEVRALRSISAACQIRFY